MLNWLERRAKTLTSQLESTASAGVSEIETDASAKGRGLLEEADKCAARNDYEQAITHYQVLLQQEPRHVAALLGSGVALRRLGRFREAGKFLQAVIELQPRLADAHNSLGFVLRGLGRFSHSETAIRRALDIEPANIEFRKNLGQTLLLLGRIGEAQDCFNQILKGDRDDSEAILGLAEAARLEGRFDDAEGLFKRVLALRPRMPAAWASLASMRKMSRLDAEWIEVAQELLDSGLHLLDDVRLRFAVGKYWDDLGEYGRAFENYREGNELLKTTVTPYNREARTRFVDSMIQVYSAEALAHAAATGSTSDRPLFVVGMPRSGTSLVEQIIASHPAVTGAGELGFWTDVLMGNASAIQRSVLPEETRARLAHSYLQLLAKYSSDALRVVDKAPVNSENLGLIHSVFPRARIIYVRRNPIDTCLSCYFQQFSAALSYSMDLGDLAHYYRQHHRQIAHWRAVLPPGTILDVPYEKLVADPKDWTRKILEFIGLEWSDRCLQFQDTRRPVVTASSWQVRQKIYGTSVQRWRHYEPYIEALLELRDLAEPPGSEPVRPSGKGNISYRISYSLPNF